MFVKTTTFLSALALTQAREFPVHVKFEDWDADNEDVEQYLRDLVQESGGAGIAIGLIVSIAMVLGMIMFWCCPCCCFDTCCLCCRKDKENRWSEKANRRVGCVMLTLSLLMCAAGVGLLYPTTVDALEKGDDSMTNAAGSTLDAMNFLCGEPLSSYLVENGHESYESYAAGKTAQEMCATGSSVVQYLTDTSCKLNSTLTSVEDFIDGLSDIVSALDNITNAIGLLETGVNTLETSANDVQQTCGADLDTSVQNLNNYADSLLSGTVPNLTPLDLPGISVESSVFNQIDQAQSDVSAAKADAQTSKNDAQSTIETDLQVTTRDEIETAKNDAQVEITDAQDDILESVPDLAEAHEKIIDARNDYYREYEDYILIGYLSFFGLGFIFVLISLCGFWRMNTCCVQCGGCMIFLVTFWLCAFMGITVLMWMITGDICDNFWTGNEKSGNRGIFQVNLANETVDIQNITINVAEKVQAVLQCQSGCVDIESQCSDLPSMSTTNTGCDDTNNLLDILAVQDEFNFTSEIQPSIDDILAYAPDLNYSSQIETARQGLNTTAVNDALNYEYDFSSNFSDLNTGISTLRTAIPACESVCNDATVTDDQTKWSTIWDVSTFTCTYLTDAANFDNTNSYYSSNCDLVDLVNNIEASVDACNASTSNITNSQTLIADGIASVDTALEAADATILIKQDELIQQADLLGVLVSYIPEEAPGHLTCDWISGAWSTTVEGDVCTHAYDSMQSAFPGMALCILGMVLAFFSMMDCANPNRIRVKEATSEGGATHSSNWDHPLAHPDGAIDESGRVRIPEEPKKYWNNRDSTSGESVKGVDGPMYPDGTNSTAVATARAAEPTAEVVAISSSSSNLYGL